MSIQTRGDLVADWETHLARRSSMTAEEWEDDINELLSSWEREECATFARSWLKSMGVQDIQRLTYTHCLLLIEYYPEEFTHWCLKQRLLGLLQGDIHG